MNLYRSEPSTAQSCPILFVITGHSASEGAKAVTLSSVHSLLARCAIAHTVRSFSLVSLVREGGICRRATKPAQGLRRAVDHSEKKQRGLTHIEKAEQHGDARRSASTIACGSTTLASSKQGGQDGQDNRHAAPREKIFFIYAFKNKKNEYKH